MVRAVFSSIMSRNMNDSNNDHQETDFSMHSPQGGMARVGEPFHGDCNSSDNRKKENSPQYSGCRIAVSRKAREPIAEHVIFFQNRLQLQPHLLSGIQPCNNRHDVRNPSSRSFWTGRIVLQNTRGGYVFHAGKRNIFGLWHTLSLFSRKIRHFTVTIQA